LDARLSKLVQFVGRYKPPFPIPENAVSFSSARTMKRFPSSLGASATKIVCPLELIIETQPKLHLPFTRQWAMFSQGFNRRAKEILKNVSNRWSKTFPLALS
jgi:hypothetical protein